MQVHTQGNQLQDDPKGSFCCVIQRGSPGMWDFGLPVLLVDGQALNIPGSSRI